MKIHLNEIPEEGLHIEGAEECDILELESEGIHPVEPVRYVLDIGVNGDGLFGTGTLETRLDFECVTCLRRFEYPVRIDPFAFQTELSGSGTVDLTPALREDILLALPPHPRCDWDGVYVCKGARSATFGTGGRIDGDRQEFSAWNALDQLKLKKTT
jgi:uncharacterized metal-binding protein YceD (DUF177 family)